MSLLAVNWKPSSRQLRQFGVTCAIALPAVAWWWGLPSAWLIASLLLGGALAGMGWIAPRSLEPLYRGIMLLTLPIGMLVSELVLLAVYVGVFVPMGLLFRCLRRDRLQRRVEPQRESYWQPKASPTSAGSYYRQS